jgi:hypothetical protein
MLTWLTEHQRHVLYSPRLLNAGTKLLLLQYSCCTPCQLPGLSLEATKQHPTGSLLQLRVCAAVQQQQYSTCTKNCVPDQPSTNAAAL